MKNTSDKKAAGLPVELLERMARALAVLAHPLRLRIIELLETDREAPVHEITRRLGVPQAAISHHLGKMRSAGLITAERRRKEVWYTIGDPDSLTILGCIRKKHGKERSAK